MVNMYLYQEYLSNSVKMPFEFERLQFSVKLSFAFTINKSQGQTSKCTEMLSLIIQQTVIFC